VGRGLYAAFLGVALALLWVTLSGRSDTLLIILGALSILLVVTVVGQMELIDGETSAFHRIVPLTLYWGWLGGEIVKANIAVARAVLNLDLDLTPRLFRVRAGQSTDFGRAIFANSITLTPGTVTVDIDGSEFIVHALLDSMTDPAGFEAMDARVTRAAEGRSPQ
jgi:multicomponent Na+:H+ antiporter subunit E